MARVPLRILLADDEPALLEMMSAYLGRLGYAVTAAGTTAKARAEMEAAPLSFAAVVIDATMAGLAMEEMALDMLAANPSLCVLAASGYPVDMTALESAAPGRVGYLPKPFTPEMLAAAVRSLLATQEENV